MLRHQGAIVVFGFRVDGHRRLRCDLNKIIDTLQESARGAL
jgi:hypothetical protein